LKAEDKLEEARFFLDKLKRISRTITADSDWKEDRDVYAIEPEFKYNLSAFVQAWRSVFDVLMYDYAEKYFLYGEERKFKIYPKDFEKIADVMENQNFSEPKNFMEWFKKKEGILGQQYLWHLRVYFVHKGGKKVDTHIKDSVRLKAVPIYVAASGVSEGTIARERVRVGDRTIRVETEKELYIAGMPETVAVSECERVLLLMDGIVKEAREKFK